MAYTKYSLTPANNTATPPDGAPEGMLPSAVNDTMRDMMAQIRDCGDGIRDGTYTMTAAKITGGTITGTTVTSNTFSSSGATITGGTINGTAIGGTTAAAGKFTTLEATGVSTFAAGTVSAPAITTSGDTNTGIFFPAADTIAFTEGGVESMRIDSSGNVGIANNNPQAKLHVGTVTTAPGFGTTSQMVYITGANQPEFLVRQTTNSVVCSIAADSTGGYVRTATNHALQFLTNNTERMRVLSGGQVGIGNSIPNSFNAFANQLVVGDGSTSQGITIYASSASSISFADGTAGTAPYQGYLQYNHAVDAMDFYVNYSGSAATRVRIDSSGNFLVGTTSDISTGFTSVARSCFDSGSGQNGIKIKVNNDSYATIITTGTGTNHYAMYMNNSSGTNVGYIYCSATATTYSTSSDYRLKENVAPMTGALARVQQLKPCTYTWKADGSSSQGFIAHELQAVVPECVTGEKDAVDAEGNPKYQGIDTSFLVATLTAAIQEQQAMIEELKAKVTALENK